VIDVYVNVNQHKRMSVTANTPQARSGAAPPTWTVRELADQLGVSTRTLRFYEAEGLIAPERRGSARVYHPRDRARLKLILRGRRFGMTLAECREIIDLYDGAATSERVQLETLLGRLAEIDQDLRQRRDDLTRIISEVSSVTQMCEQRLSALP
jgi:DNA-binding transcriptional MerR regulator